MDDYSRSRPSPRFVALLAEYDKMHAASSDAGAGEGVYVGKSLLRQAGTIREFLGRIGAKTVLDYGSGKGMQYAARDVTLPDGTRVSGMGDYWGVERVACYEPAYPPLSTLPDGPFDGVISTNVLEHVPGEDVRWVLEEMFSRATRGVFVNVAGYPAHKRLPTGENAHCTVWPVERWQEVVESVAEKFPGVAWVVSVELKDAVSGPWEDLRRLAGLRGRTVRRTVRVEG